jgi:xanthine dehydrogenase small subunit
MTTLDVAESHAPRPDDPPAAAITVNGVLAPLADVPTHTTALDFLRDSGLTGCKEGCAEGECGACSVLVARPGVASATEWIAINACLIPAASLDGQEVLTAEGLGTARDLHPVQYEMAVRGGSQCGYCTPGFICSMAGEYYRPDRTPHGPGDAEHGPNGFDLHSLSGNLCRCTGYRPIRDAAYALPPAPADDRFAARLAEPPDPPRATDLAVGGSLYVRAADLAEASALLRANPAAVLVAGSTDWGVEVNIRGRRADLVVGIDRLPELVGIEIGDNVIDIGAAVTLTEIERTLDGRVPLLADLFPQFASRLIRNGATLGGNLGTGSPIGDSPPVLLALDARLVLANADGEREVELADYFTAYRQSVRAPDELIKRVRVPLPLAELTAFHKIAKRRFDDISSVAIGYAFTIADGVVRQARIGLGGVAATPIRARATEAALLGRPWTAATVAAAAEVMNGEGTPLDDHRSSSSYRRAMLGQSLRKFFAESEVSA